VICSNCGAVIPIKGKVCPYCHADKSEDAAAARRAEARAEAAARRAERLKSLSLGGAVVIGALGGLFGYLGFAANPVPAAVIGAAVGAAAGAVFGLVGGLLEKTDR
jgi:hypothetical protein